MIVQNSSILKFCALAAALFTGQLSSADAPGESMPGQMHFTLSGKNYATQHAQGVLQVKKGRARIFIAVKDVGSRFMFLATADVPLGAEKQPMRLTTEDSQISISLRTPQGTLAVMPQIQLARADTTEYSEYVDVDTGVIEEVSENEIRSAAGQPEANRIKKVKRRKIRREYRHAKPRWAKMQRAERIRLGEGIIENKAFRDTFFSLHLIPVIVEGKVVSYKGSFAGTGRFAKGSAGGEVRALQNGSFLVKVENAP